MDDGSLNMASDSCQCCAATETQGSRCLQLDLGKLYLVQIIQILGRSGKSGRSMFIGKQSNIFRKHKYYNLNKYGYKI